MCGCVCIRICFFSYANRVGLKQAKTSHSARSARTRRILALGSHALSKRPPLVQTHALPLPADGLALRCPEQQQELRAPVLNEYSSVNARQLRENLMVGVAVSVQLLVVHVEHSRRWQHHHWLWQHYHHHLQHRHQSLSSTSSRVAKCCSVAYGQRHACACMHERGAIDSIWLERKLNRSGLGSCHQAGQ